MAFQIGLTVTFGLVNRSTGSTPARLFQVRTSLAPGHLSAQALSSSKLLNVSLCSPLPSVSFSEAKKIMLFSEFFNLVVQLKFEPFCQKILKHDHDVERFEGGAPLCLGVHIEVVDFHPSRPRNHLVVLDSVSHRDKNCFSVRLVAMYRSPPGAGRITPVFAPGWLGLMDATSNFNVAGGEAEACA